MQSASAEETIERLIFSLSELEQLGETIISGRGNFSVLSRTYLRMILGTLRATRGAILLFHPTENQLSIEESIGVREASMVIPITSDEISAILQFSIIDWSNVPSILEPLLKHIQPQLKALDANFWAPLKIRDEFSGSAILQFELLPKMLVMFALVIDRQWTSPFARFCHFSIRAKSPSILGRYL